MVGIWVIHQPKPEAEEKPLTQCNIEWSRHIRLNEVDTRSGWPKGDTLLSVITQQWPGVP